MKGIKLDGISLLCGGVLGSCLGGAGAYLLAKRSFGKRLDLEIARAKEHYLEQRQPVALRTVAWHDVVKQALKEANTEPGEGDLPGGDEASENGAVIPLLSREDIAPPLRRDLTKPYAISVAELGEYGEPEGWQTLTITWWSEDNVLTDDKEQIIPDILGTVGLLSHEGFGGQSGDENIRYVRNHRNEVQFEIIRDRRSYADVILGRATPRP